MRLLSSLGTILEREGAPSPLPFLNPARGPGCFRGLSGFPQERSRRHPFAVGDYSAQPISHMYAPYNGFAGRSGAPDPVLRQDKGRGVRPGPRVAKCAFAKRALLGVGVHVGLASE